MWGRQEGWREEGWREDVFFWFIMGGKNQVPESLFKTRDFITTELGRTTVFGPSWGCFRRGGVSGVTHGSRHPRHPSSPQSGRTAQSTDCDDRAIAPKWRRSSDLGIPRFIGKLSQTFFNSVQFCRAYQFSHSRGISHSRDPMCGEGGWREWREPGVTPLTPPLLKHPPPP